MVKMFYQNCIDSIFENWNGEYGQNSDRPTRRNIYYLISKFERTGMVHGAPKSGRLSTAVTPDNLERVAQLLGSRRS